MYRFIEGSGIQRRSCRSILRTVSGLHEMYPIIPLRLGFAKRDITLPNDFELELEHIYSVPGSKCKIFPLQGDEARNFREFRREHFVFVSVLRMRRKENP